MEHIGTTIFYIFLLLVTYLLCQKGVRIKKKSYVYAAYIFLFVVSIIRYDIGNDYSNYVHVFNSIFSKAGMGSNSLKSLLVWQDDGDVSTVLIPWLIWHLFGIKSYFLAFAVFSFVTIYFLYKAFEKLNCHKLGLFIYILTELLFFSWDWTRQCAALSLVLYALAFADERKIWKYCLCIGFAYLFHKSSLMMLPAYFMTYIPETKWIKSICIPLIFATVVAFWAGTFNDTIAQTSDILLLMENDYSKYATAEFATFQQFESFNWKVRVTIYAMFWISIIIALEKKQNMYIILLTIGAIVFIIANGSLVFGRVALYFYAPMVFAVPIALNQNLMRIKKIFLIGMISIMGLFYVYDCVTGTYTRGCVPYETIFSENAQMKRFR